MAFYFVVYTLIFNHAPSSWGILPPPTQNDQFLDKNHEINQLDTESVMKPLFRFAYITYEGEVNWHIVNEPSLSVAVTHHVSKEAHRKAALTVNRMVQHMPREIFDAIAKSKGVGIFTKNEGPTVYPEFKRFADRPECKDRCDGQCQITCTLDGRKYEQVAGLTLSRSVCLDHVVLCDDQDPYRSRENCLCHELGHLIMSFMPKYWKNKIYDAYRHAKANKLWDLKAYAMSNAQEYWAEGTGAFFRSNQLTYAAGKMNMCNQTVICASEKEARAHLHKQDPQLFELLSYVYTNDRPYLNSGMRTCM